VDQLKFQRLDRRSEDNRAWDYLSAARILYEHQASVDEQRALAYEELLIAEGSD